MAFNLEKMPQDLLDALRNRGWSDAKIKRMSGRTAFTEYCEWHGLINWGGTLFSHAQTCYNADREGVKAELQADAGVSGDA
jgi:hypothetical protein